MQEEEGGNPRQLASPIVLSASGNGSLAEEESRGLEMNGHQRGR